MDTPESDWKYLRTVKAELLETLCKRINDDVLHTITGTPHSQHERFFRLFERVMDKNEIIVRCFDDWRRSYMLLKLMALRNEGLLTEEHLSHLTAETQSKLKQF